MTGQVYALASGKGGVGKTSITANLGVALRVEGHSVALVDADLGMANLTTLLDVDPRATVHDVLAGEATVAEAVTEAAAGFGVLAGRRDLIGFAAADPDGLDDALAALAAEYDYVLVDTGGGLSYEDVLPLGMVDAVVLVTTPGPAAVGDTQKTLDLAELVDGRVRGVVVNRADGPAEGEAIADELGTALLGTIPEDTNLTESARAGQPLRAYAPDCAAARAIDDIAAALTADRPDETRSGTSREAGSARSTPAGETEWNDADSGSDDAPSEAAGTAAVTGATAADAGDGDGDERDGTDAATAAEDSEAAAAGTDQSGQPAATAAASGAGSTGTEDSPATMDDGEPGGTKSDAAADSTTDTDADTGSGGRTGTDTGSGGGTRTEGGAETGNGAADETGAGEESGNRSGGISGWLSRLFG